VNPQKPNYRKLWIGIAILVLLAPLGLMLPELFHAGGAWGEWGVDEIKEIAGYVPEGLKRLSELWSAPFSDYAFKGWHKGIKSYVAYTVSGLLGVVVVVGCAFLFAKIIKRGEK
jgi:cobalt/nickel transport protein